MRRDGDDDVSADRYPWMNLPNAITLTRIPLAAALVLMSDMRWRARIIAAGAFTDGYGGAAARRGRRVTRSGELLDPMADRIFIVTVVVLLFLEAHIQLWTVALLLLRDIGVTLGALVALMIKPRLRLPVRHAGKRVT